MHSTDLVAAEHISHSQRYGVLLLWMVLGFLYFSLCSQWVAINWRDKQLVEYIDRVIRVAAIEQRSAKEIRALILIKAENLSLPVQGDGIQVDGYGQTLTATVRYKADISMPIVNQPVYRIRFQHASSR